MNENAYETPKDAGLSADVTAVNGASAPARSNGSALTADEIARLTDDIVNAIKTVYDPEIPVNIYELGLIYNVDVRDDRSVEVRLTLTSPMCPVAGSLPPEVEAKVAEVEGVTASSVDLVWDPPWEPSMMSEAAKLELGMM